MSERLPTSLEVTALIRTVEAGGGHGAVLRRGDADRGSVILFITSRGNEWGRFERILDLNGRYTWSRSDDADSGDSKEVAEFLAKRARFDADFWAIELDIADPERFTAENLSEG